MRTLWRQRRVRAAAYVLGAASAVAAVVAATPWHRPNDNGPLPVLSGAQSVSHIDPRLSEIASSFAGRRLQVRCWSAADWRARAAEVKRYTPAHIDVHSPWSGYQTLDHRRANFGPKACGRLAALAYGRRGASSYDDAWWLAWSPGLFAYVTWIRPSARFVVPRSDGFTPAPALGRAFTRYGGQALAQAPAQTLRRSGSFVNA